MRFTPNSKYVVVATLDSRVRLWDFLASRPVKSYTGHTNTKFCAAAGVALAPEGERHAVFSGSETGEVVLWDLQSRGVRTRLPAHSDAVLAVDAHPSRALLATGGTESDRTVKIWSDEPAPE